MVNIRTIENLIDDDYIKVEHEPLNKNDINYHLGYRHYLIKNNYYSIGDIERKLSTKLKEDEFQLEQCFHNIIRIILLY